MRRETGIRLALGASGDGRYRATLELVAEEAEHRKLTGYAQKNLKKLPE